MTKWPFYIVAFLCLFSAPASGRFDINDESSDFDFWWDYGEIDQKNATYAPAMDREISRKTRVEVISQAKSKRFVADEFLRIRYLIKVPFDVRIDKKKLPRKLALFEIAGIHLGQRIPIRSERDMELQELRITLRLDSSFSYGTYVLPSFDLHYSYDIIAGSSRVLKKDTASTQEIIFQKVPVYVRVHQPRNTGFIWDIFPCFVEIRADNSVAVFNPGPNSEADSLMQLNPGYPFVLHGKKRSEFASDHYRVIRYEYLVAVQDFRGQPFTFSFPKITWQQKDAPAKNKNLIAPESCVFFIQKSTTDTTQINPLKKNISDPSDERQVLLDTPVYILWTTIAFGLFCLSFLFWDHQRQKEKISHVSVGSWQTLPVYDKWPWHFVLGCLIFKARRAFQERPNRKNCALLRELLARRAAKRLPVQNKLSIAAACALTAREFAQLGAQKQETAELLQLEHQLASVSYSQLRAGDQESGK